MDAGRYIRACKARDSRVSYLPPEYAEGKVKKTILYQAVAEKIGDLTEVAILELEPGASILQHQHTTDMERYIIGDVTLLCKCGEWHGYINNSTSEFVTVLSVKNAVM